MTIQLSEFIEETLSLSGAELLSRFSSKLKVQMKKDASIVTDADLASEKIIIERITKYYPDDLILSEEAGLSSQERKAGSAIWIIDPLDGTSNFANNYPYYCISIGRGIFSASGEITIREGGIYDPVHKELFLAERGKGAFCNGRKVQVTAERDFSQTFLVTGFYYLQENALSEQVERFLHVARACQTIRRDGAAALDLALVAKGTFDGFWEYGLQPWDLAAGSLLVQEAGGVVNNYFESSFDIESKGIVAGNRKTVAELQKLLK